MPKGESHNWARIITVTVLLIAMLIMIPGAAKTWYQIGTGLYYDKELAIAGLNHQQSMASTSHSLRVDAAKRNGTIYAALMVNSTYLTVFFFIVLVAVILTTPLSQSVNAKLYFLFPAILLWGIFFSGLSHIMISSMTKTSAFLGASVIWVGVTGVVLVILFFGLSIRNRYIKNRRPIHL
jgi:hypothetical protein